MIGVRNFQIVLLLLAVVIYTAATTESRIDLLDEHHDGVAVGDIVSRDPATVPMNISIAEDGQQMPQNRQTVHFVTDENNTVVGLVSLADVKRIRPGEREKSR